MNDYFDLFAEIDKVLARDYPSPEPVGHHYCSACGVIHKDGKCLDSQQHWIRDLHDKWIERKI